MTKVLVVLFLSLSALFLTQNVQAAKVRIRKVAPWIAGITYSKARLSRATNSIVVTFINLSNVQKISYTLSYTGSGIPQGVVGSLIPAGTTDSRDLYFGTCSHGVCTPHYRITNAVLVIETTFQNGTSNVKRYRIKV